MTYRRLSTGFTLLEILVALVLIGLLAGTLVPAVVNQLGRGEVNRVVEDLSSIETAAVAFRTDVQRWPGGLDDLVAAPVAADRDVAGSSFPTGLANRWNGPYLDLGEIPGDTLLTGSGAVVDSVFRSLTWGSGSYLVVKVKGVPQTVAQEVSFVVDGDTAVSASGKVRWKAGNGTSTPDTLLYYASPIQ